MNNRRKEERYDDNDSDENNEYERTIIDDIEDMEYEINQIENVSIRKAWELVIMPYLRDQNNRILFKSLTESDYNKFYKFFINKNRLYDHFVRQKNSLAYNSIGRTSNIQIRSNGINKNRHTN